MTLSPGTLLNDRYRIVAILGQGGMGAVYQAEDEHLGIKVAVKENLYLSDEYTRQFQREAGILASLRHSSLPRVGDYFSIAGQGQYLIMDYIEGEDLRQRIERINLLPSREVTLIGVMVCDALSYLHTRKLPIVHRDIKPGNIKITPEGQIALVDFGLAKIMIGSQATITGARAMTPGYSPPEQYGTARTDPRSDIYSLGATLYAALTGVIPEDGLARATGKAQLTPIRQIVPNVDRRVASAIEKALEVEPENRYQTAEEFEKVLVEVGNISPATQQRMLITPPPGFEEDGEMPSEEGPPQKPPKTKSRPMYENSSRPRRRSRVPGLLFLIFVVVLTSASVYYFQPNIPAVLAQRLYMIPGLQPTAAPPLPDPTQTKSGEPTLMQKVTPTTLPTSLTNTPDSKTGKTQVPTATPTQAATPTQKPIEPSPTPFDRPTPTGGGPGEIAFVSDRTNSMQIWLMNQEGKDQKQLTNLPEGACQPAWSFDGKRLAFISPCVERQNETYAGAEIYTMDVDGSNVQKVNIGKGDGFDPAWSPDGKKIAFTTTRTGIMHIFVTDLGDSSLQELSDTRYPDFQPDWRPGGKQLAFIRKTPYDHIWIMSDQGMTQFRFSLEGNINDLWPSWSSDGSLIIFSHSTIEPSVPWIVYQKYEDRTFGPEYRIPPIGFEDIGPGSMPSLSPDMQWVVYESWPDGRNHDIYMVDFSGQNRVRLTTDPGLDFNPVWRPKSP